MIREGVQCFEDARRRYDGEKRNPWDEIECGHHYVRAMAAWSGILALSGFRYHGGDKSLIVTPRTRPESFTSFWSTGTAWGTFTHSIREGRTRLAVSVTEGKLPCRSVQLAAAGTGAATARLGNRAVAHQLHREAKHARFEFSETLEVAEGATLTLTV
jgi:hypothetical protein